MSEEALPAVEENSLWQKMLLKVKIQRILCWVFLGHSIVGIGFLTLSFIILPFYFFYIGLAVGLVFALTSIILSLVSMIFYNNLLIIETIKDGRKIEQLIYLSQKTSFQDRRSFGRQILAIAALAELASKEAIEPLSFMARDPTCKHRQLVTQALTEIDRKLAYYTGKGIPSLAQLDPYKTRDGNYISLFEKDKKSIQFMIRNSISTFLFMVIIISLFVSQNIIAYGSLDFADPFVLILIIGLPLILVEYIVIISITLFNYNKIKQYLEQKNFYDLITLINKSNFGFLRSTKTIGISALADIGSPEAIPSLIQIAQTSKIGIQNKAILALDVISVKNGIDKRYILQIH